LQTASSGANSVLEQLHGALRRPAQNLIRSIIHQRRHAQSPRTVAELMQEADGQMTQMKNAKKDFIQIVTSEGTSLLN
jgi:hypothetical protein